MASLILACEVRVQCWEGKNSISVIYYAEALVSGNTGNIYRRKLKEEKLWKGKK